MINVCIINTYINYIVFEKNISIAFHINYDIIRNII